MYKSKLIIAPKPIFGFNELKELTEMLTAALKERNIADCTPVHILQQQIEVEIIYTEWTFALKWLRPLRATTVTCYEAFERFLSKHEKKS